MRLSLQSTLVIASIAVIGGCGAVGNNNDANQLAQTLTVYSSLPLQGPDHDRQQSIVNGEKLALAQAGGHVGPFHVSIASLDDADPSQGTWTPGIASQAARQAAQDKSTIAFIGDFDSGATAISLPLINEGNILQISPASTYTGLTQAGADAGKGEPDRYYPSGVRTFARLMPSDSAQAAAVVKYMRGVGARRLAVVSDLDVFDSAIAEQVAQQAPAAGIKVLGSPQIDTRSSQADHSADIRALVKLAPDSIMIGAAPGTGTAALWQALHQALPQAKLFASSALATPPFLTSLDAGTRSVTYVVSPVLLTRDYDPAAQRFLREYRRQFTSSGTGYSLYGYEAMRSALAAVRAAGRNGADRLAVVHAYFRSGVRDSVLGRYTIAPDGDTSLNSFAGYRVDAAGRLRFERRIS